MLHTILIIAFRINVLVLLVLQTLFLLWMMTKFTLFQYVCCNVVIKWVLFPSLWVVFLQHSTEMTTWQLCKYLQNLHLMKAQSTIENNTVKTKCFEHTLLLHLLLLILLMNHSSLCLHQSHACERQTQGTETKRQREVDGEGVRARSLAWYEWRAVEDGSVFPAWFLLSQFVLLMFLGAVLLIVHFSVRICRRAFQKQVHNHWFVCISQTVAICNRLCYSRWMLLTSILTLPISLCISFPLKKKHCACRYTFTNAVLTEMFVHGECVFGFVWEWPHTVSGHAPHSSLFRYQITARVQHTHTHSCTWQRLCHIYWKAYLLDLGMVANWFNKSSSSLHKMMIMLLVFGFWM